MTETASLADLAWIKSIKDPEGIPMECCVHEIVDRQAQLSPSSIAVEAWDGSLTYSELAELSSSLAAHLIVLGVQPQDFVLIVFEKCRLAIVAVTAILKTGAICVPLDPSNASKRLATVLEDTQAQFVVASSTYSGIFATGTDVSTVVADTHLFSKLVPTYNLHQDLARAKPEDAAFLMYSSGSTGRPKGIIQQHGRLCFSIRNHSKAMGITAHSRTLQFAAYTFDTSMSDIYGTFMQGAVLCVCSDWDRLNGLSRSIRSLNANYVCLTPTVAEQLEPNEVPSLQTLCVGGETLTATLVDKWADKLDLINVYGITECLVWTFTTKPIRPGQFTRSIGRPACGRAWITVVDNPSQLLPVGAIGELLIEGPNLAREYLNDATKTAETFISPPQWLQDLELLYPPPGRIYRTGDLVRYAEDGTIEFLGRKDTQVKLNGQRVELGEIEYHMKRLLPSSAQVAAHVLLGLPQTRSTLVASICLSMDSFSSELLDGFYLEQDGLSHGKSHAAPDRNADFEAVIRSLRPALMQLLPSLLVPTAFVPIQRMPLTVSGKLDRRMLQQMVTEYLSLHPLESTISRNDHVRRPPSTETEKQLAGLWSTILGIKYQVISSDHEFVRLGGDSAQAMKLVGLALKSGLRLTVADILQHQRLSEMANVAKPLSSKIQAVIPPFALIKAPAEMRKIAARQCELTEALIQDAYPCTPLQQGLLALSLRHHGAYVAQTTIEIPCTMSSTRLMKAWERVYRENGILRTRIIETDEGLIQVVINEDMIWIRAADYDRYLHDDRSLPMTIGSRLNRFAIINNGDSGGSYKLVWTAHHCTYDGWSAALVLQEVSRIFAGQQSKCHTGFNHFISYLKEQDVEKSKTYWKEQLRGLEAPIFPIRANPSREPQTVQSVQQRISLSPRDVFTSFTLVRAALTILISKYSNTDDIIFGTITSGRSAAIKGIDTIIGPTFSTVPIRIRIDEDRCISDFLEQVQKQSLDMMPHEALGLQNIRQFNQDTQVACDFQCLLITQPLEEQVDLDGVRITYERLSDAGTYPLTIDCKLESGTALFEAFFDSGVLKSSSAERVLLQLDGIIQQLRNAPRDQYLKDIDLAGPADKALIWDWNAAYPSAIDRRVCEVIEERCALSPSKEAVCSWDGNFTYKELDTLSFDLSQQLMQLGVEPEIIVPISFERSKWVVVAMLAVNKAGGAFVLLNPTHPVERLQGVVSQINSHIILSSRECLQLSQKLLPTVLVVEDFLRAMRDPPQPAQQAQMTTKGTGAVHSRYTPSDLLYVVFTSGTSGTPKGIMIENRSFCTYIDGLAKMTNAKSSWRGLVSSAYSFDSSLEEMLMPLMIGGTICMPSQHELSNDLTGAMNRMNVHWGVFTPSLARLIDPRRLTTLTDLYIGGEQMTDTLVQTYGSVVHLTNTYGPSECCPTGCVSSTPELYGGHIGRGVACRTWIVDPINHERLMPVGCVGELILDGPNVGRGYLHDEEKTRAAFIDPPSWLRAVEPFNAMNGDYEYPRRMYKTGDLVRYCSNGTMEYIGRKDQQVKLYGQRIELLEIEHHIQSCLLEPAEVIVEVATRNPESHQQMLVAFIVFFEDDTVSADTPGGSVQTDSRIVNLRQSLARQIPSYMLPSLYLKLQKLPLTSSDKIDRRQLKQSVLDLTEAEFLAAAGTSRQKRSPETEIELELQILWSEVLRIDKGYIGLDDEFFRMGGDSIQAIRLATFVRKKGWSLTVADITRYPSLEHMSHRMTRQEIIPQMPASFSLIPNQHDQTSVLVKAAECCGVESSAIEDIYPCSPLQEGLMALSLKHPLSYIANNIFELPGDLDVPRLSSACCNLVQNNPILRTRIVYTHSAFYQVVLKNGLQWKAEEVFESDSHGTQSNSMGLGTSLCRFASTYNSQTGGNLLLWTIHHSLYDGWSMNLLHRQLYNLLRGHPPTPTAPYSLFIRHVKEMSEQASYTYWKGLFAGAAPVHFPKLPRSDYSPRPNRILERSLEIRQEYAPHIGISNVVYAAWAIAVSRYTECNHVSYGITTSGRKADLLGIEAITGPTFATVPTVVRLDPADTKDMLLHKIQEQSVQQTEYEQLGLENIRNASLEAKDACAFQTLFVVQPVESGDGDQETPMLRDISLAQPDINTHPLNLECQLTANGLVMKASFDTQVISEFNVFHLLSQFCHVMRQLCSPNDCTIKEITTIGPEDMARIAAWNRDLPQPVEACIHDLVLARFLHTPAAQAVGAWDGDLTYAQLEEHSRLVGLHLQQEENLKCGDVIPLLFDKSVWAVVAMLAVLRTGATCVFLDLVNHPLTRMQKICEEVEAKVVVCGLAHCNTALLLASRVFPVGLKASPAYAAYSNRPLISNVCPRDAAFIIFTSGSTGTPKGIVHEHQSLSTSYAALGPAIKLSGNSRVYQFSAFTFDMCVIETLATLVSGGTVCIPSEDERLNDVEGSFSRFKSNWAFFTPSFARQLNPAKLSGLNTLCLGGEAITQGDVDFWTPHVGELMTISGPAETSLCTAGTLGPHQVPYIGNMIGGLSWITEITDHAKLAPVGVIGELLVEGPVLAREYLNQPLQTANAFVEIPDWLSDGPVKPLRRLYRTGDLVRYNSDGSMQIFGRRDGQIKIRGQRVELEEVEHQVSKALESQLNARHAYKVAVDAFSPADDQETTYLAIFVATKLKLTSHVLDELTSFIIERLHSLLPPYMVPTLLVPLPEIPMIPSKKIDRKRLRSIGAAMSKSELAKHMGTPRKARVPPSGPMEEIVQRLWSRILRVDVDDISSEDKFLQLRGDSIRAVSFVSSAREEGLYVTVADVFRQPRLCDLAAVMQDMLTNQTGTQPPVATYRAAPSRLDSALLAAICNEVPQLAEVECADLRRCTPTQNFILAAHLLGHEVFQPYMAFEARLTDGHVEIDRLVRAWEQTVAKHSILRTVLVSLPSDGGCWYQLVLDKHQPEVHYISSNDSSTYEQVDDLLQISRSHLPACQLFIKESGENRVACTLHMSHALLDGGCVDELFACVASCYGGIPLPSAGPQYRDFQYHLETRSIDDSMQFWSRHLKDLKPCLVPTEGSGVGFTNFRSQKIPLPNMKLLRQLCVQHGVTLPILIHAAWASTVRRYTSDDEVTFGYVVSNRDIELTGVEKMIGPVFGILASRLRVEEGARAANVLKQCHEGFLSCLPYRGLSYLEYYERLHGHPSGQELFNTVINHRKFVPSIPKRKINDPPSLILDAITSIDPYAYDILLGIDDDDNHHEISAQLDYWGSRVTDAQAQQLAIVFASELETMGSESQIKTEDYYVFGL